MGLGQFFVDIARVIAGRYSGGPAKVSVVSSAFFGTISGSSIANTVSTGSLTIPNMKRMGYPGHFAGGVEAASSAGGQITPPIMGAASFLMAEILEVPYSQIVIAAIIPAAMHYLGVMSIVHFEAKRLGLAGIPKDQLPQLWRVLKTGWPTLIPLIALIYVLFSGYSPFMAAFWGITACIVVGFLNPMHRMSLRDLLDAFEMGVKYALAVGAAAAAVGIVVGVITMTGVAFRLGFMVTNGALQMAESIYGLVAWLPFELFSVESASLFFILSTDRDCLYLNGGRITHHGVVYYVNRSRATGAGESRSTSVGVAFFSCCITALFRKSPRRFVHRPMPQPVSRELIRFVPAYRHFRSVRLN